MINKRQNPSGFFLLLKTKGFCFSNLAGTIKFKCERKNEKVSGRSSKMTLSCKWPIRVNSVAWECGFKTGSNIGR